VVASCQVATATRPATATDANPNAMATRHRNDNPIRRFVATIDADLTATS